MDNRLETTEIKDVFVMVGSIVGLHSVKGYKDPAMIAEALRNFHSTIDSILRLYGWMRNSYSGEQVIAYTVIKEKNEFSTIQALNIPVEIRSRIEGMVSGQEFPEEISFCASITAGEAVLMHDERNRSGNTAVLGYPVDMGSRIMDMADPGQILVDATVYNFSRNAFDYQALEPIRLKGLSKPVVIYELKGRKRDKAGGPEESFRMISSEMVGRSMELKEVEETIKQLLNGRGSVINIEGPAGIGKSRLIAEVRELEIIHKVMYFEGRALSEGKNLSFHPIIQIIKSWSGITNEDSPSDSFIKLTQAVNRVYPEQETEIIPFVATMMGYPLESKARLRVKGIEGEALEKLILKNVRDLLSRLAFISPIVILIEDAHWADLSTVSFLESLFKLVRNYRILFINVFRQGYKENGERIKNFTSDNLADHSKHIILKPLNSEQSLELIGNLMNNTPLPGDIKDLIIARAEGNPFFIEEVIRSFIDEGLVEVSENGFKVTGQISFANIPETIDQVILSRIEKLDEKTKSLLKTASVIGRNFYYKVLEEATQTIKELDSRLDYLTETQLLSEHRHKEDVEFLFKHALAQQATYDSIIQKTKKDLHLKIARSIEKVFADKIQEFYGILAHHYGKAEVQDKREEYLIKAGDEAFKSGASSEAVNYYLEALRIITPNPENEKDAVKYMELEIKVGFAQEAAGNNIEAVERFKKILTKYFGHTFPESEFYNKYRGISSMLIVILKMNFSGFFFKKRPDEKFDTFMKAVTQWAEAMTSLNPRLLFLQMNYFLKNIIKYDLSRSVPGLSFFIEAVSLFMWTGISFKVSKKMIDYARNAGVEGHPSSLLDYRFIKRMYDFHVGNLEEEKDFGEIYKIGMHIGDFWPTTIYTLYSGLASMANGNYPGVTDCINKLEEISESFDNSHARAQAFRLSALAHSQFGMADNAIAIADEGIHYTSKTGHFAMLLVIWSAKSMAHSARNELEEARKALSEAEKLVAERKIMTIYYVPYLQAKARLELSELRRSLEQKQPCREQTKAVKRALNTLIRQSKKMCSALTEAYRLKAQVYCLLHKQKKALSYFTLSIKAGQKYNSRLELSRTYFEAGKCLRDPGSIRNSLMGVIGSEYLLKAKNLFEEMDLQQDLRRYEEYIEQ